MNYYVGEGFALSGGIAAVIGWIRFKKIDPTYYPFIYIIWIGFTTEIISYIITHMGYYNGVLYNIYVLVEALFITWQFRKWQLFEKRSILYFSIQVSYLLFWFIECFYFHYITYTASYFRLYDSIIISLMSINIINSELMTENRSVFKNPVFLICIAFAIYYIYKVIVGVFRVYGLNESFAFRHHLEDFMPFVDLLANLIFALAILWMPKKHRFLLRF